MSSLRQAKASDEPVKFRRNASQTTWQTVGEAVMEEGKNVFFSKKIPIDRGYIIVV